RTGARGEHAVLVLQRLEHQRHEERGADEEHDRRHAHAAELVAHAVAHAVQLGHDVHRFTSFQAAEMANDTGCCGSFCRTSCRTSCTCESASFWLSVST